MRRALAILPIILALQHPSAITVHESSRQLLKANKLGTVAELNLLFPSCGSPSLAFLLGTPDRHGTQSFPNYHLQLADESVGGQWPSRVQATPHLSNKGRILRVVQFLLPPINAPSFEACRQV